MTDFSGFDVFSEKAAVADADRVQLLDPELLYPDPENVRSAIDEATIDEMAETIKERGQLQPITVAPKDEDGRYRIMFGERRWRACRKLGMQVRAIVSKRSEEHTSELQSQMCTSYAVFCLKKNNAEMPTTKNACVSETNMTLKHA